MCEYFWTLSNLNASGKYFSNQFMTSEGSSRALIYIKSPNIAIKQEALFCLCNAI